MKTTFILPSEEIRNIARAFAAQNYMEVVTQSKSEGCNSTKKHFILQSYADIMVIKIQGVVSLYYAENIYVKSLFCCFRTQV